jgi:tetratricopeptide (TPR) repeat protein
MVGRSCRVCAALSLALATATVASAPARADLAERPADQWIEVLLPPIEARLRLRQSAEAMAIYATRVDREGRLLWAWSNSDDQAALEAFQALVAQDPPLPWAYAGMARVYLHWKIWDQADAALARAINLNPAVAEFWVLKGDLERLREREGHAEEAYRRALRLRPTPFADDGLGLLAMDARHPGEARSCFIAARALWADDYVAARGLADVALATRDWRGALNELERLHQLAPQNLSAWHESIEVRKKLADSTGIVADAEAAVRLGDHDPVLLGLLLASYQQAARTNDELRVLKELDVSGAADAKSYRLMGDLEAAAGRQAEALDAYQKAIVLAPKDAEVLQAHAHLLARRGMLVEAIDDCRQLQALNQRLDDELSTVSKSAALAPKPISGRNIAAINSALGAELHRLYRNLLRDKPALAGTMRLQVSVAADGRATGSEYRENTVGSPELAANLYWNARDARYPRAAARYVFSYELRNLAPSSARPEQPSSQPTIDRTANRSPSPVRAAN